MMLSFRQDQQTVPWEIRLFFGKYSAACALRTWSNADWWIKRGILRPGPIWRIFVKAISRYPNSALVRASTVWMDSFQISTWVLSTASGSHLNQKTIGIASFAMKSQLSTTNCSKNCKSNICPFLGQPLMANLNALQRSLSSVCSVKKIPDYTHWIYWVSWRLSEQFWSGLESAFTQLEKTKNGLAVPKEGISFLGHAEGFLPQKHQRSSKSGKVGRALWSEDTQGIASR